MISPHGMLEPWALAHKGLKKRLAWPIYQKRILQRANCLHATSQYEGENLRRLGLTAPIAIIPWGVEVSECGRRGGNFCGQEKSLLFMGRLHPVKGLPLLLEAWAKVTRRGWKLRIAGPDEGGHQTELQRLVGALGIQDSVEFLGPVWGEAKEQMFLESDLFVLPTYSENFGIAVAEAMAYGLPVITTHGAPWKVLEEEGCGWWVPVSVEGIAAALEDALRKEPEELAGMGALGRKIVAERFAWSAVAEQFLESYRWLLGRGGKPAFVLE